jgi:site-specific recombinase XerD
MTLAEAIQAFLRSRDASGCTPATLKTYRIDLGTFCDTVGASKLAGLTPDAVETYLAGLRSQMEPISVHRRYRALRTFCRWLVRTGRLSADPMASLTMRVPQTLPRVPSDDDVRRLLAACPPTFEGQRNSAMIALLPDSGLRKEEIRWLRIGDVDLVSRMIRVRQGKGLRDGVTFIGAATAPMLRAWLMVHPDRGPENFLLVRQDGSQLGPWAITRILHRISRRTRLAHAVGAHALRHYAATAILRRTGDLELVRRMLRHSTLAMALRYAILTQTEIAAKFTAASPVDNLRASRQVKGVRRALDRQGISGSDRRNPTGDRGLVRRVLRGTQAGG